METRQDLNQDELDLYALAHLITGDTEAALEVTAEVLAFHQVPGPFFSDSSSHTARRLAIAEALGAIRDELAASARRVDSIRWEEPKFAPGHNLGRDLMRRELEQAILAIDAFPRCALLLCIFEGLPQSEAAALLGAEPRLVTAGQALGLCQLTRNVNSIQSSPAGDITAHALTAEFANA